MYRVFILYLFLFSLLPSSGQAPAGYYLSAEGKTGQELRIALHYIIDNHTVSTYTGLWTHFQTTDKKSDGKVWDMYSDRPGFTPPYVYTFVTNQCGNYDSEADCYNREHSFPKSWFGGEVSPMYTDLFHLFPTDGWVNNKRGNYPFGKTNSPTWTSMNGSKVGPNSTAGYSGVIFEPIDAYKGDFARAMFYMAARYWSEDTAWPGSDMVDGSTPKEWAKTMLMQWHADDPVSQKEVARNDEVYIIQSNRNPFVDRPEFVNMIWGAASSDEKTEGSALSMLLYPVPAIDNVKVVIPEGISGEISISVVTLAGKVLITKSLHYDGGAEISLSGLPSGTYILILRSGNLTKSAFLPVIRR